MVRSVFLFIAILLAFSRCEAQFDPPSLLNKVRVLAIGAYKPTLLPGEATQLTAFVVDETGEILTSYIEIDPITGLPVFGPQDPAHQYVFAWAYCITTMEQCLSGQGIEFNLESLPIGTSFYFNSSALSYTGSVPVSLLVIKYSEDLLNLIQSDPQTIATTILQNPENILAFKEIIIESPFCSGDLDCYYAQVCDLPTNTCVPSITNLNPALFRVGITIDEVEVEFSNASAIVITSDTAYDLKVYTSLPEAYQSKYFEDKQEQLTLAWYSTAGEYKNIFTVATDDGTVDLPDPDNVGAYITVPAKVSTNIFSSPGGGDLPPDGVIKFYLTLRDMRGGSGWLGPVYVTIQQRL